MPPISELKTISIADEWSLFIWNFWFAHTSSIRWMSERWLEVHKLNEFLLRLQGLGLRGMDGKGYKDMTFQLFKS